ncbi:MAG: hypothetical protein E6J34_20350 [Chloroflexi bacterium]|nr:MAG: hypothetical protein E6J34_20350 [Chloroflexota bacterium]
MQTTFIDFLPKFFPTTATSILEKARQRLWVDGRWNGLPETINPETDIYQYFVTVMNNILQARELHTSATWHSHAQKSPTGAIAKRKPDIFLLDTQKVPKSKTGTIHWRDVLVVGELKQSDANNSKADMQLASYAREVFGAQMNRRFVFGITICGFRMRVWLFDRAGGISSQTFNINDDPKAFLNVIIGFATMYRDDRGALGYDMTISSSRNGIGAITVGSKGFILDEIVYSHPVVSGRATICWKAHKQSEPGTVYAIKDSW